MGISSCLIARSRGRVSCTRIFRAKSKRGSGKERKVFMASEQKAPAVRPVTVVKFAGAVIATLIGSGFASGQEAMQFFAAYGTNGIIGCVIAILLFAGMSGVLLGYGFKHKGTSDFSAFRYFCGKYLGTFLEWFTILFCFLVGIIMVSGAGATLNQYFGVPQIVGSGLMAAIVLLSALFGLKRIVDILGSIGPVTIAFLIILAVYTLVVHGGGLADANAAVEAAGDSVVYGVGSGSAWFALGAFMYVAYNILAGVPFMSEMGTGARSRKEAVLGGALGGAALGVCALLLNLALLSVFGEAVQYEVPVLFLAQQISPVVGLLFAVILLAEIYNTAVPMVWTVANQFVDEKQDKRKYQFLIALLCAVIFMGGQLPFGMLVNLIYPFVGYFGALFIVVVIVQMIRWRIDRARGITR